MFWRRGGSRFDYGENSWIAWIIRIAVFVLLAAGIILMVRLWMTPASAEEEAIPYALDAGWKGEKVCELLFENEAMRAMRCSFPPGVGHEKHFHPPHWGYIVGGGVMRITDKDGTREQPTPAGATWWSDGVEWHDAVNIGDTTTVYVMIEPKGAGTP